MDLARAPGDTTKLTYVHRDELISLTDPLQRTVTFEHDAAGRVKRQTLPGDRTTQYSYDANGNVVSLTPPARPAHHFGFSSVDLATSYQPPALAGASEETSYAYNRDRDLMDLTRAPGDTTKLTYDEGGRLATVGSSTRTVTLGYDGAGRLASLSGDTGPTVTYTWDGSLPAQVSWSGEVTGKVSWGYDTDLRPAEEAVNGAPIAMTYDADSLLRSAGALDIQRDPIRGHATGTTLGGVTDSYTYDEYGALKSYSVSYGGTEIFRESFTRDALGRIATETGTLYGVTSTRVFAYDAAGRIETVTRDGVTSTAYAYDPNGNRLSTVTASSTFAATYDVHDRLMTYGEVSYTYTAAGNLLTKTSPAGTTTYSYDSFGNLRTVNLSDGARSSTSSTVRTDVSGRRSTVFFSGHGCTRISCGSSPSWTTAAKSSVGSCTARAAMSRITCSETTSPIGSSAITSAARALSSIRPPEMLCR
jgi:YD repeat-containing protein